MALAYIPFDEVNAAMFLGKFFSDVSDESEEYISDHHESESVDDIYEENNIPSSNSGDSNAESDSNGMCFLFVCLSTRFKCLKLRVSVVHCAFTKVLL